MAKRKSRPDIRGDDGEREWVCKHGVGHPYAKTSIRSIHTCDGCCSVEESKARGDNPKESKTARKKPQRRVTALEEHIRQLHWMARRYADGRSTYAVSLFNDITADLLRMGVELDPTEELALFAHDGMEDTKRGHFCLPDEYQKTELAYLREWRRPPQTTSRTRRPHDR